LSGFDRSGDAAILSFIASDMPTALEGKIVGALGAEATTPIVRLAIAHVTLAPRHRSEITSAAPFVARFNAQTIRG
jgi:hypothetical protein